LGESSSFDRFLEETSRTPVSMLLHFLNWMLDNVIFIDSKLESFSVASSSRSTTITTARSENEVAQAKCNDWQTMIYAAGVLF
jgi:hypothetical protein